MNNVDNIVLIGMAGAGKSTVGVLLAKALSREFVDTDLIIQAAEGQRLQSIIDSRGLDAFRAIEERHLLNLGIRNAVVATGGSVIYCEAAMTHLSAGGQLIYLQMPLGELKHRLSDIQSRGVLIGPGQTFEDVYAERLPLYEHYADITVQCEGLKHEEVVSKIVDACGLD